MDCTAQIIVAADVTNQVTDVKQAEPLLDPILSGISPGVLTGGAREAS